MEQDQGKARRHYTPDQKFKIVKEQMTTKTSVSEICKKYDISCPIPRSLTGFKGGKSHVSGPALGEVNPT